MGGKSGSENELMSSVGRNLMEVAEKGNGLRRLNRQGAVIKNNCSKE